MVAAGLRFFVKISNPPWTWRKIVLWVALTLALAAVWIAWREVELGVFVLPGLNQIARGFLDSAATLGPGGLFALTAVATLFFFFLPSEPYYVLALASSSNVVVTVIAAALGSIVGACANFWFGEIVIERRQKKRGDAAKVGKWLARAESKWGEVFLFLAMALPAPEIIAVGYGAATFSFRKFLIITTAARFIKWTWVALAYLYFSASF